jgi:hypothetical protein
VISLFFYRILTYSLFLIHRLESPRHLSPNQQIPQSTLDSSSQSTDHGVFLPQHDIYIKRVNLAIGYTIPSSQHMPSLRHQTHHVMSGETYWRHVQIRTRIVVGGGRWYGSSDAAARTSDVGYDAVLSVLRTYVSSYMSTRASIAGGGTGAGSRNRFLIGE